MFNEKYNKAQEAIEVLNEHHKNSGKSDKPNKNLIIFKGNGEINIPKTSVLIKEQKKETVKDVVKKVISDNGYPKNLLKVIPDDFLKKEITSVLSGGIDESDDKENYLDVQGLSEKWIESGGIGTEEKIKDFLRLISNEIYHKF
jgi:hypothetical protein